MKRLLVGAAAAALLCASPALAHDDPIADGGCLDEACDMVALFPQVSPGLTPTGFAGTVAPRYGAWGFDLAGRDTTVDPGDDFFRHANGGYMDALVIPADRTRFGSFDLLRQLSDNRLEAMMAELTAASADPASDEGKVANLYRSYMDEARLEQLDAQPLEPLLAEVRAADSHEALARLMGARQGGFGGSFFGFGISDDARNPDRYAVYVGQSGLGLPNRDYYLSDRYADKKAAYQAYVQTLLTMVGWDQPEAMAQAIVDLETRIAEAHWTPVESRNRDRTYNPMTPAELVSAAPGFDFVSYMNAAGLGEVERLVIRQDTAMPKIAAIFGETPVATLQAWQAFHTADDAAPFLSKRFVDAHFDFRSRELAGQPEQRSRQKRGVSFAEGAMGEALGRLYVAEYFPAESKAQMEELVANLRLAMANRIRGLEWMSEETKLQALDKLEKFGVKIGYPSEWRDYSALEVRPDDLFGNQARAGRFRWEYDLNRLNGPVDDQEWGMTPQTVNAYYSSVKNEIVFPAAILQAPFFDPNADPAVNYGGIGGVIGHEIGHGFDDQGRKSDGDGVLRDWWTPADAQAFEARTARLGAQYDQYEPLPGYRVQGGLTMGENIGDLAGVTLALEAYRLSLDGQPAPVLDGVTGDQRVFYGWAQVWRGAYREDAMKNMVATDPHSPPQFRVIGPLRNIDAWYDAFDVQPDDANYLAPEDRVRLW
ncbi:M13 family metallopeptidase [Brevundimonas balnearis]|uniref:M13 family metallopeptidase n=1 Tax=Brevundimonas balnearis TaxID=1572858 RepID=A0ABV6R3C4_9CAUL